MLWTCAGEPVFVSVLDVRDLRVDRSGVAALRGVSFAVERGASVGVVGSSGSGKTTLALAVMGLLPTRCTRSGSVRIGGVETVGLGDRAMSRLRGKAVSMVFQDPAAALNPVLPVGAQIAEAALAHQSLSRGAAADRSVELLELAGTPRPSSAWLRCRATFRAASDSGWPSRSPWPTLPTF